MTDMRERVARAIWQAEQPGRNWEAFQSWNDAETAAENKRVFNHADAALLACGYAEMRKAMEALIECHGDPEAIAAARSILERTGEK